MNNIIVTIPMKNPLHAKTRLAPALMPAARARLVRQLYARTLQFFVRHFSQLPLAVVTNCDATAQLASHYGAIIYRDDSGDDLNGALRLATRGNIARGFSAQLILPADIAQLRAVELDSLLAAAEARCVVIGAAADRGTNALLLSPPDVIDCAFGNNSSLNHAELARRAGLAPRLLHLHHLSRDVDRPGDLALLPDRFGFERGHRNRTATLEMAL